MIVIVTDTMMLKYFQNYKTLTFMTTKERRNDKMWEAWLEVIASNGTAEAADKAAKEASNGLSLSGTRLVISKMKYKNNYK